MHGYRARCARHTDKGGGRIPRVRERTHKQWAHDADLKGNRTEPAERTDCVEWRTSRRRKGTSGQDNPQHALRGARGKRETTGGGLGELASPPPP